MGSEEACLHIDLILMLIFAVVQKALENHLLKFGASTGSLADCVQTRHTTGRPAMVNVLNDSFGFLHHLAEDAMPVLTVR